MLLLIGFATPAAAQQQRASGDDEPLYYDETETGDAISDTAAESAYRVVYQQAPTNTRAGLAMGLSMPGFLTFQAFYQSFSAIVDGLYLDFRLTGSTFADEVYGDSANNTPMFENVFETDFRVGFGTRNTEPRRATIKDSAGNRFQGRVPDSFGVAPYIGWRGRWGYNMQAVRLGIHVERDVDAEVLFGDGRPGQSFQQWAFDFELFYALHGEDKGQEGIGVAVGFDYYFNNFVFTRGELGFAVPNDNLDPEFNSAGIQTGGYDNEVNAVDGFFWKLLIGFSYQFNIPNSADKAATRRLASPSDVVPQPAARRPAQVQEEPIAPAVAPAAEPAPAARVRECASDSQCDDGIFCNGQETCTGGVCLSGELEDDDIPCTQLVCDEEGQTVRQEPIHSLCGDGQFCNGTERCNTDSGCVPGSPVPVDDGDPCTNDYCDESLDRIVNEPIPECISGDQPATE